MFIAINFNFCPVLNLSIYLESLFPKEENQYGAVNLSRLIESTPEKIKSKIQDHFRGDNSEDFVNCASSMSDKIETCKKVGTHSIYKLAVKFVKRN